MKFEELITLMYDIKKQALLLDGYELDILKESYNNLYNKVVHPFLYDWYVKPDNWFLDDVVAKELYLIECEKEYIYNLSCEIFNIVE